MLHKLRLKKKKPWPLRVAGSNYSHQEVNQTGKKKNLITQTPGAKTFCLPLEVQMDLDRQLTSRSTTNQMIARTLCDPFSCLMASFKVGTDTLSGFNCEQRIKRASLCDSIAFNEKEGCCKQRARILTSLSQPRWCPLKKTKRPILLQYGRLLLTQSMEGLVSRIADNWH